MIVICHFQIHTVIYTILPMIVLSSIDAIKIFMSLKSRFTKNTKANNEVYQRQKSIKFRWFDGGRSLNLLIAIFNACFLIVTLPASIISCFLYYSLRTSTFGNLILVIINGATFSYHSLKFFILIVYNQKFKKELYSQIKLIHFKNKKIFNLSQKLTTSFSVPENSSQI